MNESKKLHILLVLALLVIFGVEIGYIVYKEKLKPASIVNIPGAIIETNRPEAKPNTSAITKFIDEKDFKTYLASASDIPSNSYSFGGMMTGNIGMMRGKAATDGVMVTPTTIGLAPSAPSLERVSDTNVQVKGIDEPDMVKTNGRELFLASEFFNIYYDVPMMKPGVGIMPNSRPEYNNATTKVIDIFPVEKLAMNKDIAVRGDMLLEGNTLLIFATDGVYAYDVAIPVKPVEKWTLKYAEQNQLLSARLYSKKIYLITQSYINQATPCPFIPFSIGDTKVSFACSDIYHPTEITPIDTTYVVSTIDVTSGAVGSKLSFVGSANDSEFYMSPNALYLAYYTESDTLKVLTKFFDENNDIFPAEIVAKLKKVADYDLTNNAKMTEYSAVMEKFYNSLNQDDRLKLENDIQNRFDSFSQKYLRDFESTNIVKIDNQKLSIEATGTVPGRLLNQFSLDEFNNNLRVATTSGGRGTFVGTKASINDVYVLDKNLKQLGSVKDLGANERIYSVRFIGNRGYVVTFRETDPFYVLDLSNPAAPAKTGELKIPGYSAYLDPIADNLVLGIGKEDQNVKISLFNVADAKNPIEVAKYNLKEYWSEILNTHHAFLLDTKHKVFFLPGATGAYIFSYTDKEIKLVKAVGDLSAKRAVFVNDYLYAIGSNKIVVLDEKNWAKVKELTIK